ncbi:MAG TPA: alpha/beta hydrolase [Panacibacter sp.]|nr:alpha/beta hydrolase [Panacibacter sp.]
MQIFFLSGLGADKTVFKFLDLSYCEPVFIDWIKPDKDEPLNQYALRLKKLYIPDDAIIIGLSFGGMLATEIAKKYPSAKVIILSGAKTKNEIPSYYKTGKYMAVQNIAPGILHKWLMLRMKWLFGLKDQRNIKVYEDLIRNSNPVFNKWAIYAILNWQNTAVPPNIFHIHGTHDKVLPYRNVTCNHTIKKGGHLMVMEQSGLVSKLLKEIITTKEFKGSVLSSSASQFADPHLK